VVVTGITAPLGPQTPAASLPVVLPGARGQAGAAALATFADNANVLAMRQYRVTPPVMTDTQLLLPQVDVSGNDKSAEQFAAQSENNVLNVTQVQMLPVVSPTFAMSKFVSAALATNAVVKASPGVLFSVSGRMDISAAAANYWLLAMDAASLPANGAVTIVWSTKLIMPAVQVDVPFSKDFRNGVYFASGLVFALGITTEFTLTIGAQASLKLDSVLYK
jgi:hypothetical protein